MTGLDTSLFAMRYFASARSVERADDTLPSAVQDVDVDLGSGHIGMPQQFLHRANVVTGLDQMRGERMPQRMRAHWLHDARPPTCRLDRSCQYGLVDMVSTQYAFLRIGRQTIGRKYVLPAGLPHRMRVLAR